MTTKTNAPADAVWDAIDDQRARTADLLEQLTDEQWEHPSLCEAWTVRQVAAHLTLQQQRLRDAASFIAHHPRMLRSVSLNATIHDSALVQARVLSREEIVARIRAMRGSRRHNAFVTPLETLTDIVVHSQDIAIPLGLGPGLGPGHALGLEMRPDASELAATRRWDTRAGWLGIVFRKIPLEGHRLTATDTDWRRGDGLEVSGPIGALLLLLTGRDVALDHLSGEGADALRSAISRSVRPLGTDGRPGGVATRPADA